MRPRLVARTQATALLLVVVTLSGAVEGYSCPSECSCHPPDGARVDCSYQSLTAIPEGLDPNVTFLDLSHNNLLTVDGARLRGLWRLQRLDLSGNYISLLGAAAFAGLPALEELDLSSNRISRLAHVAADALLANLTRLTRLSLAGNQLRELQEQDGRVALASPSLRELQLSSCHLQRLDHRATLARMPSLQILNVSDNPIKWIRELESGSLHTLDASRCELDSLGAGALRGLTSLVSLRLDRNPQLRLGEPRLQSQTLRSLHAQHCALDAPALRGLPALQYAFLRGNKVEVLRQRDFNNSGQLIRLELSRNLIRYIEKDAFRALAELERLDLSGNKLHQLAWDAFVHCRKLKWLLLSENPLTELTNISSHSIRTIDASQCKISGLRKNVLMGAHQLLELNLSSNWIESVPNRLRSLSLVKLDLSQCRLSSVSNETFVELYQLRYLYLHGNRLTNVPKSSMVTGLQNLVHLTLHDNPWRCDCAAPDFRYLWDNLTVSSPPILTVSERQMVKCASPEVVSGQQWWLACVEKWYPPSHSQASDSSMSRNGAAALGLIAVVVTAVALFCFLRQRLQEKEEARAQRIDEMARAADDLAERLRRQHSEALLHQELEAIARSRTHLSSPPRQRRTESQLTEPPTYEEALLMARSVEELAERNAAAAQAQAMTHAARRPSGSDQGSSLDLGEDNNDDDGQYARAAGWSQPSGHRRRRDSDHSSSVDDDSAGEVFRGSEDPCAKCGPIPGSPGRSSSSSAQSYAAAAGTSSEDEARASGTSAGRSQDHRRSQHRQ